MRGQLMFMERHLTKLQLLSAGAYFVAGFPRLLRDYSRILGEWSVPLYLLWGMGGYVGMRLKDKVKRRPQRPPLENRGPVGPPT